MGTSLKQSRLFACVIEATPKNKKIDGVAYETYPAMEHSLKEYFSATPARWWAILHYCDINEQKEVERLHWHLVIEYFTRKTYTGVINDLSNFLLVSKERVSVDYCKSKILAVRYLLHLDDPEKANYLPSDVLTNDYPYLVEALSRPMDELTIKDIEEIVANSNNEIECMKKIGLKNYARYRCVIRDIIGLRGKF